MKRPAVSSNSGAFLEFYNNAGYFLQDTSGNFQMRIGAENNFITLGDPATQPITKLHHLIKVQMIIRFRQMDPVLLQPSQQ